MATIFRVTPKTFTTPADPKGYVIEGISARINTGDIGDQSTYSFSFVFYCKDKSGAWVSKDGADIPVRVIVTIPSIGNANLVALLVSPSKADKYKAASIICLSQNYQLLPIEQQDTLLEILPT